ncbi:hypothetical protein GOODEAATRI_031810, partial [Goodea atripinnis]
SRAGLFNRRLPGHKWLMGPSPMAPNYDKEATNLVKASYLPGRALSDELQSLFFCKMSHRMMHRYNSAKPDLYQLIRDMRQIATTICEEGAD